MNGWQIALVAWFAFAGLFTVARIGKEPKPTTPGSAVLTIAICAAWIYVAVRT